MESFKTFIETGLKPRLARVQDDSPALWGLMQAQQMVEHLLLPLALGLGNFPELQPLFPEARLAANYQRNFVEKQMLPRNVKMPLLSDQPRPLAFPDLNAAKAAVLELAQAFVEYWEASPPDHRVLHPVFGQLNAQDWAYFQEQHLDHHLRQFGC